MANLIHNHQLLVDQFAKYWSEGASAEDIQHYYANLELADVTIGEITIDEEGRFVADISVAKRGLTAPEQSWTPGVLTDIISDKITTTTLDELKEGSVEGVFAVDDDFYIGVHSGYADAITIAKQTLGYDFEDDEITYIAEADPETAGFVGTVMIESKMTVGEFKLIHLEGAFLVPPTDLGNLGD